MLNVDVDHQINAVRREVGARMIDEGEAHIVTISQVYDTDAEDLWDAVTNIERIPRWLMPITGELKLGGSYQLKDHAGGTILTCNPPERFTATWEYGGNVSWVEATITGAGPDRSRLEIEHIARVDDEMWRQFGPGAVGIGWDSMVLGLALHIATGQSVDSSAGQEWTGTDEGRRFLRLSGEGWRQAHVDAGEDSTAARAAADRCLAAYYGEAQN